MSSYSSQFDAPRITSSSPASRVPVPRSEGRLDLLNQYLDRSSPAVRKLLDSSESDSGSSDGEYDTAEDFLAAGNAYPPARLPSSSTPIPLARRDSDDEAPSIKVSSTTTPVVNDDPDGVGLEPLRGEDELVTIGLWYALGSHAIQGDLPNRKELLTDIHGAGAKYAKKIGWIFDAKLLEDIEAVLRKHNLRYVTSELSPTEKERDTIAMWEAAQKKEFTSQALPVVIDLWYTPKSHVIRDELSNAELRAAIYGAGARYGSSGWVFAANLLEKIQDILTAHSVKCTTRYDNTSIGDNFETISHLARTGVSQKELAVHPVTGDLATGAAPSLDYSLASQTLSATSSLPLRGTRPTPSGSEYVLALDYSPASHVLLGDIRNHPALLKDLHEARWATWHKNFSAYADITIGWTIKKDNLKDLTDVFEKHGLTLARRTLDPSTARAKGRAAGSTPGVSGSQSRNPYSRFLADHREKIKASLPSGATREQLREAIKKAWAAEKKNPSTTYKTVRAAKPKGSVAAPAPVAKGRGKGRVVSAKGKTKNDSDSSESSSGSESE